jgi:hypothetical protein
MIPDLQPRSIITVKTAYNGTARGRIFSFAGRFRLTQVLKISILGTPDPRECKDFPPKRSLCYSQVPLKTGFTVPLIPEVNKDIRSTMDTRNIPMLNPITSLDVRPAKQNKRPTRSYSYAVKPTQLMDEDVLRRGVVPSERLGNNIEIKPDQSN